MSGNFPDGTNQANFDRYWEDKLGDVPEEERTVAITRQKKWLSEVLQKPLLDNSQTLSNDLDNLAEQVIQTCEAMGNLERLKNDMAAALRECLEDYCVGCGSGEQGTSEFHHQDCRMFLLLQKAEGRRLKQNMEPEEE